MTSFVTSSVAVSDAATWVKLMYDKIMIGNEKKRKYGNHGNLNINLHLMDGLVIEFTACYVELMTEGALTSFTVCDA